jgi:hypothetical protein
MRESNRMADEIGEALQRVASASENSNISLEKSASWLATISSITRESASTIGRSLNSVISRYESIKKTGFNSEDSTKLNDVVLSLSQVGIVATDSQGQLRDFADVMDELGAKFKSLSKNEQAYITTTLFGTYQRNRGLTLLNNYQDSLKNYENALNSAGVTEQKFAIYQESINSSLDRATASVEGFWQHAINSDIIKTAIDGFSELIDILDILVNNSFSGFVGQVGLTSTAIALLGKGIGALKKSTLGTAVGVFALDVAEKGLLVTTKALTVSMLASPLFWIVAGTTAIYAIIKGVDLLTISLEEQKEIVNALSTEVSTLQSEYDKLNSTDNKTEEQEKYLKLLEREIELKKQSKLEETNNLVNKKYFTNNASGNDILASAQSGNIGLVSEKSGSGQIEKYIKDLKSLKEELSNSDTLQSEKDIQNKINGIEQSLITSRKEIKEYIDMLGTDAPPVLLSLADSIDEVIIKTKEQATTATNATSANNAYRTSYEELNKTFETSTNNLMAYNDMIKELEQNHKLSAENVNKIFKDYPQLLAYLGSEQELREQLIKLKDEEAKKQRETYIQMIQDSEEFYNLRIKGNVELTNEIKDKYDIDLKNFRTLAQAKEQIESTLLKSLSSKWGLYFDATRNALTTDYTELLRVNPDMAKQVYGDVVKYFRTGSEFNDIVGKFVSSDFSALNLSKTGSDSDSKTDYEKPYEKQYQIIKNLNFELDKQNELLSQAEDLDKIPILSDINDKLKDQQDNLHALNEERRKEFDVLSKVSNRTKEQEERYQELVEKIQDTSLEWWRLDTAQKSNLDTIKKINEEQLKSIENQIKETVELEKKLALQKSENKLKEDLLDLEQEIFGTTQDEWEEASNTRIDELEEELDLLDEKADKEKESEERAKRKLEIAELELKLQNLQNQKTVQQLTKDSNGNWQFSYVADQEEIESVQDELKEKQEDFDKWEDQNRLERKRKKIQSQIEEEKELQKIKKDSYDSQKKDLETAYQNEKNVIEATYWDIDAIVAERMDTINATHNAKLDEMLVDARDKLSTLKRLYEQALDMQSKIEEINVDSNDSSSGGGSFLGNIWNGFKDLIGLDTGGYTGNNEGIAYLHNKDNEGIAYLHNKELVLNKLDTANLLKAVDITRNLVQGVKFPSLVNKSSTSTQQIFQISKIEFPNATDTASIQEAILTLPQIALQRVHSK